jgi:hypothetical protein
MRSSRKPCARSRGKSYGARAQESQQVAGACQVDAVDGLAAVSIASGASACEKEQRRRGSDAGHARRALGLPLARARTDCGSGIVILSMLPTCAVGGTDTNTRCPFARVTASERPGSQPPGTLRKSSPLSGACVTRCSPEESTSDSEAGRRLALSSSDPSAAIAILNSQPPLKRGAALVKQPATLVKSRFTVKVKNLK